MKQNSQFGTIWITDGTINKKIKAIDQIPDGWNRGRSNVHSDEMKCKFKITGKNNNSNKRKETILNKYGTFLTDKRHIAIKKYHEAQYNEKCNSDFSIKSKDHKRLQILKEQNYACLHCGLSKWLDNDIKLELDHIDGNNKNNSRENLRLLCPNCHSFTDTWRKRKN
jgi:hypothetical protein